MTLTKRQHWVLKKSCPTQAMRDAQIDVWKAIAENNKNAEEAATKAFEVAADAWRNA